MLITWIYIEGFDINWYYTHNFLFEGTKNTEDLSTVSTPVSKTKVPTDTPITAKKMEIDMKVDTPVTSRKMDVDPDKGSDTPFIAKLNINTPSRFFLWRLFIYEN